MGLQGILFYFIAALFYFILFYMCGRLKFDVLQRSCLSHWNTVLMTKTPAEVKMD